MKNMEKNVYVQLKKKVIFKASDYISITNSDLNRPGFAWHPYGKSGLFKTELVIAEK